MSTRASVVFSCLSFGSIRIELAWTKACGMWGTSDCTKFSEEDEEGNARAFILTDPEPGVLRPGSGLNYP